MSRSYHHHPCWVDRAWKKWGKIFAKRLIRKLGLDELANGAHYKRFFEQYDICDYIWHISKYTHPEDWEKERRK